MSGTKSYTTTRILRHNGKKYESGADVDLDNHFADPLLSVGAIRPKTLKLDETDSSNQDGVKKPPAGDQNPPVNLDDKSSEGQSKDDIKDSVKPAYDDITAEKIKEKLTELNIDFTGKTAKKDLYDLLPS